MDAKVTKKKLGRPPVPEYRKKRVRIAAVEDALLPTILRLPNSVEKNELLSAFEELKKVN